MQAQSDAVPPTGAGVPDYWSTMGGVAMRLEMLGNQIEYGTFNGAVKIVASSIGVFDFMMVGEITPTSCEWCEQHVGRIYRLGQFMPNLPKHPHCAHWWDIRYVGEKR